VEDRLTCSGTRSIFHALHDAFPLHVSINFFGLDGVSSYPEGEISFVCRQAFFAVSFSRWLSSRSAPHSYPGPTGLCASCTAECLKDQHRLWSMGITSTYVAVKPEDLNSSSTIFCTSGSGNFWEMCSSMTRALTGSHLSRRNVGAFRFRGFGGGAIGCTGMLLVPSAIWSWRDCMTAVAGF
jgi:hypothetical protein